MDRTSALIVAAGLGTRAGTQTPKQFAPLSGKPMVAHVLARLAPQVDQILINANQNIAASERTWDQMRIMHPRSTS